MADTDLLEMSKLESVRWEILRVLYVAGYRGTTEGVILTTLRATWFDLSREYIRNQAAYLEDRKLVKVIRNEIKPWHLELTHHGDDVANYVVDCEAGIARPTKYWHPGEQIKN